LVCAPLPVNPSSKFFYNKQFVHSLIYLAGTKPNKIF